LGAGAEIGFEVSELGLGSEWAAVSLESMASEQGRIQVEKSEDPIEGVAETDNLIFNYKVSGNKKDKQAGRLHCNRPQGARS